MKNFKTSLTQQNLKMIDFKIKSIKSDFGPTPYSIGLLKG